MAWGTVPSQTNAAAPSPVNLYQQQLQQWQQQQQQVQELHRLEQERQKRLEEELRIELQQQLQKEAEEKARKEREAEERLRAEEDLRRQQERQRREELDRQREAEEERLADARALQEAEHVRYMNVWQETGLTSADKQSWHSTMACGTGSTHQTPGPPSQDEPEQDATEPSASPRVEDDDADTEAPTEESDYDPFAGAQARSKGQEGRQGSFEEEYNPFAGVAEDDAEDEGAFDSLIEMLRAAEREGHSPSRASESLPQRRESRPLDTGEHFAKAKPKPKTNYHFNHVTQRWEPKAAAPSPPRADPSRGGFIRDSQNPHWRHSAPASPPTQAPRKLVIAECEAEARADAANGFCTFSQAFAVRLALRFESRPKDILVSMTEAGLPAAKDQRSTVKAIMRLCHPDKCKHPDAKRAMQILGPLLT